MYRGKQHLHTDMYTSKTSSDWRFNEIKHEHNVIVWTTQSVQIALCIVLQANVYDCLQTRQI